MVYTAACLGGSTLLFSIYDAVTGSAPSPTNALTRSGLAQALQGVLGQVGGNLAYHLIFAAVGICVLWVGIKILRDRP
jgi:hypothetical protein